jgi:hypothetical protein
VRAVSVSTIQLSDVALAVPSSASDDAPLHEAEPVTSPHQLNTQGEGTGAPQPDSTNTATTRRVRIARLSTRAVEVFATTQTGEVRSLNPLAR